MERKSAPLAPLRHNLTLEPIGARDRGSTHASFPEGRAVFRAPGVTYFVDTECEACREGRLEIRAQMDGGELIDAVLGAGAVSEGEAVSLLAGFDEKTGTLTLRDAAGSLQYTLFLKGRTLVVLAEGDGCFERFETGRCAGIDRAAVTSCVYVEEVSVTSVNGRGFLSAYLDKAQSFAAKIVNEPAACPGGSVHGMTAHYEKNSAGERSPLRERFYITLSNRFLDCVYLTNAPKSPCRDSLNSRIVYDNWHWKSSYDARMEKYTDLSARYGLRDVLLVEHRWQRDTLDISNPAHYPASTKWGDAASFRRYLERVRAHGWTVALHEDYWFIQPSASNQYWNDMHAFFPELSRAEDAAAQNADGSLRIGWQIPGSDYVSYANRSDMMEKYVCAESTQIQRDYTPDASFVDVNGGVDPLYMNQVTYQASCAHSRTVAQVVDDTVSMLLALRRIYRGPVISEGAQGPRSFGSAYAGYLESGSREITGCHDACRIMPDYELRYIRPLMANQGMGPLGRFQVGVPLKSFDMDKYNAVCLAYGHAGFIGDVHYDSSDEKLSTAQMANTYYMFRAIQEQYLDSENGVREIVYFDEAGRPMDLDEAVLAQYDFCTARLRIVYENGLTIWLNFSGADWPLTLGGRELALDQNGWAAENPAEEFLEFSCKEDGRRIDFVRCTQYCYTNLRDGTPARIEKF